MAFFPFMIQLDDKKCLIAGGGKVAYRKVKMMLSFGAFVNVTAPDICKEIIELDREEERLSLEKRKILPDDIDDKDVVIMATNDSLVNKEIATLCKERRILVNVVDVKEDCGFYFPAVIKQGDVVISVSTGGNSPLLASRIKKDIQENIRDDYGKIADEMGKVRESVINSEQNESDRKEIFEKMIDKKLEDNVIRIGTRGSKLALIQTDMVIDKLKMAHPEYKYEKIILSTKGDKQTNVPITSFGGKAVFVEEFEKALTDGKIDIAVHSAKDMPNPCKDGLLIAGTLERACPQDVLIYPKGKEISRDSSIVIGTGSLRRSCQIRELFPNAICKDLRGNIGTRIDKLKSGKYDAIILAAAGLERQGLTNDEDLEYRYFSVDDMIPAAGQAIIAIETKEGTASQSIVSDISDKKAEKNLMIERAVLTRLNAGCHEPVGVFSEIEDNHLSIRLITDSADGIVRKMIQGSLEDWEKLVEELTEDVNKFTTN